MNTTERLLAGDSERAAATRWESRQSRRLWRAVGEAAGNVGWLCFASWDLRWHEVKAAGGTVVPVLTGIVGELNAGEVVQQEWERFVGRLLRFAPDTARFGLWVRVCERVNDDLVERASAIVLPPTVCYHHAD